MSNQQAEQCARRWVERVVVELELCPFAKRTLAQSSVRYRATQAPTGAGVLEVLRAELDRLDQDEAIETTLIVLPRAFADFLDYNDFLDTVDELLRTGGWEGTYQIASFHPDYQFAGAAADDPANYTNRSPDPMLHILREDSLAAAIAGHPDSAAVLDRNIELLADLGVGEMRRRLHSCRTDEVLI